MLPGPSAWRLVSARSITGIGWSRRLVGAMAAEISLRFLALAACCAASTMELSGARQVFGSSVGNFLEHAKAQQRRSSRRSLVRMWMKPIVPHTARWLSGSSGGTTRIWMSTSGSRPCSASVMAQHEVVHRVFERHAEFKALPLLGIALVGVLVGRHGGLAVDILNRRASNRARRWGLRQGSRPAASGSARGWRRIRR